MRHHNRSRLIALTDQGLDPRKKYVVGKNGSLVEAKSVDVKKEPVQIKPEDKLRSTAKETQPKSPVLEALKPEEASLVVESSVATEISSPRPEQIIEAAAPVEIETILPKEDKSLKKKKPFVTP